MWAIGQGMHVWCLCVCVCAVFMFAIIMWEIMTWKQPYHDMRTIQVRPGIVYLRMGAQDGYKRTFVWTDAHRLLLRTEIL